MNGNDHPWQIVQVESVFFLIFYFSNRLFKANLLKVHSLFFLYVSTVLTENNKWMKMTTHGRSCKSSLYIVLFFLQVSIVLIENKNWTEITTHDRSCKVNLYIVSSLFSPSFYCAKKTINEWKWPPMADCASRACLFSSNFYFSNRLFKANLLKVRSIFSLCFYCANRKQ